ncbi:MAG: restriction endonuclease subunit S [Austwickia sp.]|nr:restriction endonuclease subunit S [Austwickia sp.]
MTAQTLRSVLEEGNGSIKTGPFGTVLSAAEYVEDGVPLISVGEIGYGSLQLRSTTPRISADTVERLPDYVLRTGDVVFGRKGAVDRSSRVRPEEDGWFLGSDGIRVRFGRNVDPTYMAYCLLNPAVREWLLRHAGGSTLKSLNERTLGEVPLSTPFLAEQRAIAEVLGALDDKIAANHRLHEAAAGTAGSQWLDACPRGSRRGP